MMDNNTRTKTAEEIGLMAGMLSAKNYSDILNIINALLFAQNVNAGRKKVKAEPAQRKVNTNRMKSGKNLT